MTTYTTIPDASLEPGKPARSVDAILLRDNPLAIAEGDATAPKIGGAIAYNGVTGDVGTYAFLHANSSSTQYDPGDTAAGSLLRYASAGNDNGVAPSGTWRCMGFSDNVAAIASRKTVWLRIL